MKKIYKHSAKKVVIFMLFTAVIALSASVFAFAGADEGRFSLKTEIHGFFSASSYENTHVNTGNKAYDIISVAKTQIGYTESGNNLTKYGEYFSSNGTSWCAMFIVWCARQAGITPDEITFTTWATADDLGIEYRGRNAARTEEITYTPLPGDVIIYDFGPSSDSYGYCYKEPASFYGDHVGLVEYVKDGYVHTIEGNYSDTVKRRVIALDNSEIKGYGVPSYNKQHIHYYTDDIVVKPTSCAGAGSGKKICFCMQEFTYSINALEHTQAKAVRENEIKATCTSAGSYDSVIYCSVCKKEISRTAKSVKKLSHTEVTDSGTPATCTKDGMTDGSHCSVCGTVIKPQEIIKAQGHIDKDFDSVCDICETVICVHTQKPVLSGERQPACTESGYTGDMVCPVCAAVKVRGKELPATGHSFALFVSDNNVTCIYDGTKTAICNVCGEKQTMTDANTRIPHTFGKWITETQATYVSKGVQSRVCTCCGFTEERTTSKKPTVGISDCEVSTVGDAVYTAKALKPSLTVKNGDTVLKNGVHYKAVYSDNINMGKAKITLTGITKNGYSGTKTVYFKIVPDKPVWSAVKQTTSSVTLSWQAVKGAEKYAVYKYNSSTGKFSRVLECKTKYCTVSRLKSGTEYKFYVKAYGGSSYGERSAVMLTATKPASPKCSVKQSGDKAAVTWNRVSGADGYEVYVKTGNNTFKKYADVKKCVCVKRGMQRGTAYYFRVRAYKVCDGKKLYSAFSAVKKTARH